MDIGNILDGWGNRVKDTFNMLDLEMKNMGAQRLRMCDTCTLRNNNTCDPKIKGPNVVTGAITNGCGCNLSAKTLAPKASCPLAKW